MPHDYSYTQIEKVDGKIKQVTFMPSTVETIDQAFFKFIDEELNISSTTNKGFKKVPVIWVSAERAFQIKELMHASSVLAHSLTKLLKLDT